MHDAGPTTMPNDILSQHRQINGVGVSPISVVGPSRLAYSQAVLTRAFRVSP